MSVSVQAAEDKFSSMARQMGKWVDHVIGKGFHSYCPSEAWVPSINLYEDELHYIMVVELAGIVADQIDLSVENGTLIISGDRATPGFQDVAGSIKLHHMEIDHGRFCRTITLPDDVAPENIEAFCRNGFLWVRMPKKH